MTNNSHGLAAIDKLNKLADQIEARGGAFTASDLLLLSEAVERHIEPILERRKGERRRAA